MSKRDILIEHWTYAFKLLIITILNTNYIVIALAMLSASVIWSHAAKQETQELYFICLAITRHCMYLQVSVYRLSIKVYIYM